MDFSFTTSPSYVVIFRSLLQENSKGYEQTAKRMGQLAKKQAGFVALSSARQNSFGITVSYWESLEAIKNWKENAEHLLAQKKGKQRWYQDYSIQICKITKNYKKEKNETLSVDNA
jgi:heme-degrading monooxygenase HmoA